MEGTGFRRVFALLASTALLVALAAAPVMAAQDKVTLCHKPGTSDQATITVAEPAENAHLAHDDTLGECVTIPPSSEGCTRLNSDVYDSQPQPPGVGPYYSSGTSMVGMEPDERATFIAKPTASGYYPVFFVWFDMNMKGWSACFDDPEAAIPETCRLETSGAGIGQWWWATDPEVLANWTVSCSS